MLASALQQQFDDVAKELGLSAAHLLLVLHLDSIEPSRPSAIALSLGQTAARVGMQLGDLLRLGLCKKEKPSPALDQRGIYYTLTAKGEAKQVAARERLAHLESVLRPKAFPSPHNTIQRWLEDCTRAITEMPRAG